MNATATPTPIPSPASASRHPISVPKPRSAEEITGQRGSSAGVMLVASAARMMPGPALMPGSGMNTNTPDTRASTRRNAYSVPISSFRSVPILGDIAKDGGGVGGKLVEHPRHQQHKASQERSQPGEGTESRILQGGRHLDQVHDDADAEADHQQRRAQPEGRHQGFANHVNCVFGGHEFYRDSIERFHQRRDHQIPAVDQYKQQDL